MRKYTLALSAALLAASFAVPVQAAPECRPMEAVPFIEKATESINSGVTPGKMLTGKAAVEFGTALGDPDIIAAFVLGDNELLVAVWREEDGTEGICYTAPDDQIKELIRKHFGTGA